MFYSPQEETTKGTPQKSHCRRDPPTSLRNSESGHEHNGSFDIRPRSQVRVPVRRARTVALAELPKLRFEGGVLSSRVCFRDKVPSWTATTGPTNGRPATKATSEAKGRNERSKGNDEPPRRATAAMSAPTASRRRTRGSERGSRGSAGEASTWPRRARPSRTDRLPVSTACAGKRGRRCRRGEEDTTTNQTSALDGRAAVVGGMVVVAASIGAVLAVVWEEIFGRVGGNRNWPW